MSKQLLGEICSHALEEVSEGRFDEIAAVAVESICRFQLTEEIVVEEVSVEVDVLTLNQNFQKTDGSEQQFFIRQQAGKELE